MRKSQYSQCSSGAINIQQANEVSTDNVTGILDLRVDLVASESTADSFGEEVNQATASRFGYNRPPFDLVLYCQPPGLGYDGSTNWVAYAYLGRYDSYYNDYYCRSVSAQMHEVGHNLFLQHSGKGDDVYGDESGRMGYSYGGDDTPIQCFNAAKSYQLGWYPAQMVDIDPLSLPCGSQSFVMNGIVDYDDSNDGEGRLVVLRLAYQGNRENGLDWYIGYNRQADENIMAQAAQNKITIIEKSNPYGAQYGYNFSGQTDRIADLSIGQSFSWNIGSQRVNVTYNSLSIDGRDVSITIEGVRGHVSLPHHL